MTNEVTSKIQMIIRIIIIIIIIKSIEISLFLKFKCFVK